MTKPKENANFGKLEYWEERFRHEDNYEWLSDYRSISELLKEKLPRLFSNSPDMKSLVVGCGNSDFSKDLVEDGVRNLVSCDYSTTVIENMKQKYPDLSWIVQDMTDLSHFINNSLDFVLDKAAMDALVVNEGDPWNPNIETTQLVEKMVKSVHRVLKPSGKFVQISFQQPHFRLKYLQTTFKVETFPLPQGLGYFLYICSNI